MISMTGYKNTIMINESRHIKYSNSYALQQSLLGSMPLALCPIPTVSAKNWDLRSAQKVSRNQPEVIKKGG
jgi:hypothetical protein